MTLRFKAKREKLNSFSQYYLINNILNFIKRKKNKNKKIIIHVNSMADWPARIATNHAMNHILEIVLNNKSSRESR